MPTVPVYDSPQVSPGSLPRVEVRAPNMPDVAGRPAREIGQGMMRAGNALDAAYQQANEVRAQAADNALAEYEVELGYGEGGAFTLQGADTLPNDRGEAFSDRYLAEYDRQASAFAGKLGNDQQRALFATSSARRRLDLHARLLKHEAEQTRKYQDSTYADAVTLAQQNAVARSTDPRAYGEAVQRAADLAAAQARSRGEPVEQARIKAVGRIEYEVMYNRVQGATRKEDLFLAKGVLSTHNPNLSHEDQNRLMAQVNDRIDRFDKEAEVALKQSQATAMKEMTDLAIQGKLTPDVVLDNSDRLSGSDRNTLAGILRGGVDDLAAVRRLQIGVLTGTVGEQALTRAASTGQIAPDTYRRLMGDVKTMENDRLQRTERKFDTEEYKAAREFIRLNVPSKPAGGGGLFDFTLSSDDSERLANALTALYRRAQEGKADHLKWAQEAVPLFKARPGQPAPGIEKTPSSGPITDGRTGKPFRMERNAMQIAPEVQQARDAKRAEILRAELAAERANLAVARTPEARRQAERNIRLIGRELQRMGATP